MKHARILNLTGWLAVAATTAVAQPDFQSKFYTIGLSRSVPAFSAFAVDSLGQGKLAQNPILAEPATNAAVQFQKQALGEFAYVVPGPAGQAATWRILCKEQGFLLQSDFVGEASAVPFTLVFNQKANHATLLGLMKPGERQMSLPCVLHLPDMGSVQITSRTPGLKLDYDARRHVKTPFVQIAFPPANPAQPHVEYQLDVTAIYPRMRGLEQNPRYDGFRRDWLNIFQVNPRFQMLANNSASDPCTFTIFKYAAIARQTPPLAAGLTALDLIRMTLDRYVTGAKGYGQVGYGPGTTGADIAGWSTPWTSLDSLPSLLIAACDYIEGAQDRRWAKANYDKLAVWAREMMAADKNGNGLIAYPATGNFGDRPLREKRPSNWWDTINFGHEDAYANALAYHACRQFAELARQLERVEDAQFFDAKADKLRAAYVPTFLNPATGVLAGWKSADGQLHDYWFTFVQGAAITYGLLDDKIANGVMDSLLTKMQAVGYTNFALGLPGNLVPIKKGDYVLHNSPPTRFGEPKLDDGSDGFQYYENGGATGCFSYFTIKALYQLGRITEARRILYPMLAGYAKGDFQGFDASGMSKDWRDWKGGGHGYEGLLVDNYLTLLAVLDDVKQP